MTEASKTSRRQAPPALKWLIYPASWVWLLIILQIGLSGLLELRSAWLLLVATLVFTYMLLERLAPLQDQWAMTRRSFIDDLKYLVTNGATLAIFSSILAMGSITMAGDLTGPASEWPLWAQLIAMALIFEALQYGLHRFEHEGPGRLGRFMWRVHSAHHLPKRLYIVMHVAGHPINALLVQGAITIIPIWAMGYDARVVTTFLMINSMHGLLSHFNVDVRIGWINYLFIGPELHRHHHSADPAESKNYGATISLYDQLLGTFVYRPGRQPNKLGVSDPQFPEYGQFRKVMVLPFTKPQTPS